VKMTYKGTCLVKSNEGESRKNVEIDLVYEAIGPLIGHTFDNLSEKKKVTSKVLLLSFHYRLIPFNKKKKKKKKKGFNKKLFKTTS